MREEEAASERRLENDEKRMEKKQASKHVVWNRRAFGTMQAGKM